VAFSASDSLRALAVDGDAKKLNEIGHKRGVFQTAAGHARAAFTAVQNRQITVSAALLDEFRSKP
jgi:hypothetical protein